MVSGTLLAPPSASLSLSCEVNESEDRLLSIAAPKEEHLFGWKSSRRSICASPKVRAARELGAVTMPSDSAAGIGVLLIVPAAHRLPPQVVEGTSRFVGAPQEVSVQVRAVMLARLR